MAGITNAQYDKALAFLGKLFEYVDDVDAILRDVADHYDADRAYVFELSEDRKMLDNTYEWCKDGVTPEKDNLQGVPYESVEVWFDEFERVGAFFISSLDKDVETDSLTYQILEPQGIESLVTAPIYREGKVIGFIGVDNPHINTDDTVVLQTTASIINSEISRKIANKNKAMEDIRDIIASANMGTWRIELVDNEAPRMYADDTMKRLLGIDSEERTPEKTYEDWFSNITPDAVPSVLASVERMQQGSFDENTYLWQHPSKGIRYVRCGGTANKIPGGFCLQGYHYDVDEVVRKDLSQMLELQKAMDDKKEYYGVLGVLGDIFYSLHVVDLRDNSVFEFNARNEVKELAKQRTGAVDMMAYVMNSVTSEEYLESALEFTNLTTLSDRMIDKKIISKEFVGKNVGWFIGSFITLEADDSGRPVKVIWATRVIDDIKREKEQLIKKTQTDELTGLLNRRAYEESIYEHNDIPSSDKFIYISIDVNGLKVVNDTLGHMAGDELIIGACQCMRKALGSYGNLYRIGGDEFVAILYCGSLEIKRILSDFDETVANWKGKLVDSLSVSYGWIDMHEKPGASTRQLGAIAEERMYAAKSSYYHKKGVDRRGQLDAHKVLCDLYTKILKINITDNSYQIVNMDPSEQTPEKGFADTISEWLREFGIKGQVHPDDLDVYLKFTSLDYMKEYFAGEKTSLHIFYRRKFEDDFKKVMMEVVPANDYTNENQSLFLYVKNIDR